MMNIDKNKILPIDNLLSLRGGGRLPWDGECAIFYNDDYQGVEMITGLEGDSAWEIDQACATAKGSGYSCFCNYMA